MRKNELITKSREAMLAAVQIYNNPLITFKSESFITLSIIGWTYLLHAYFKEKGIDFRYCKMLGNRNRYDKTKYGAYKHWELERCLNDDSSPIDKETVNNLKFLIGIRHEIEHQMTKKIDSSISAKLQSCAINYNFYLKKLFDDRFGLDEKLGIAIQLSPILEEQKNQLLENEKLPQNMESFMMSFESELSDEEISSERYAYRVLFTKLNVNRKGQADRVVEFLHPDSPLAQGLNKEYHIIKETERMKYIPSQIVKKINEMGYKYFGIHHHTQLWQSIDYTRKELVKYGYCVLVANKEWMWYDKWVERVEEHCKSKEEQYRFNTDTGNRDIVFLPGELANEIRRLGYEKFKTGDFTTWRKQNGVEKDDKRYGLYNISNVWVWKKIVLEMVLQYCQSEGNRYQM